MDFDYIIVQAGGKGTRLEYLTHNKPKALVSINNLPMMFHLFKKYPDKKFIIIGDYKFDVMEKYLSAFAEVPFLLVDARGKSGTCAGIQQACEVIPDGKGFLLIWSDLILPDQFRMPENLCENYIGISGDFPCRWSYMDDVFMEEKSVEHGVAGFFYFTDKKMLAKVPAEGELVRWMQSENMKFSEITLAKTKEYGLLSEYNKLQKMKCRPFNEMKIIDGKVFKKPITEQGEKLAKDEVDWYKKTQELGYTYLPRIDSFDPLVMEYLEKGTIYDRGCDSAPEKRILLKKIVDALSSLHSLAQSDVDYFDIFDNYVKKTFDRLSKVRDLVPFAKDEFVVVNGKRCRNVFFIEEDIYRLFRDYKLNSFSLIHGDCTFSNMMLNNQGDVVLIDPRGYFGKTKYFGDTLYDWAKVYYSLVGNYDQFNLGKFTLDIREQDVELKIESNGWEELEEEFLSMISDRCNIKYLKLVHAVIWLSLTTYAWNDYDMICGAFYNGLYYLEECLE